MAIKYYQIPGNKIAAVMSGTQFDAVNKIHKLLNKSGYHFCPMSERELETYLMPDDFKIVVACDPRDEYDFEVGKKIAKEKLLQNYHRSLDKRIDKFKDSVAQFVTNLGSEVKKI